MTALSRLLRRVRFGQDGFTLLEVLIATFILVLGALGIFITFVSAIHNVQRGRETQIALSVAQREMEKIRSLPTNGCRWRRRRKARPKRPARPIACSGSEFALNKAGTERPPGDCDAGVCSTEKPCVNSEPASSCVGGSSPGIFTNGTASGAVYCYVTTLKDEACEKATGKTCTYRRVVVAVWLAKPANQGKRSVYFELQSNFFSPS